MQLITPSFAMSRAIAVVAVLLPVLVGTGPTFGFEWRKASQKCEPPWVFHNDDPACPADATKENPGCHQPGRPPCCPMLKCPGRTTCECDPPSSQGTCMNSATGQPEQFKGRVVRCPCDGQGYPSTPTDTRKSIVMFVTDDQASCAYGSAGTCYSIQTGRAMPAPVTPALDDLAARGTAFPIVHNTASWCFPSLASILTARYQVNMGKVSNRSETFATLPQVLRGATIHPGDPPDTYETQVWRGGEPGGDPEELTTPVNRVGGYCTYFGGKFVPQFANASAKGRHQGRLECIRVSLAGQDTLLPAGCDEGLPSVGLSGREARFTTQGMTDLFDFIDSMILEFEPGTPKAKSGRWQRFFAWHFPFMPHRPLVAPDHPTVEFLFTRPGAWYAANGLVFPPGTLDEGEQQRTTRQYYGSVLRVDANLGVIRQYLQHRGLQNDTVIIHLSDNPWFMLRAKKNSTENGYRTRLIVYDPALDPGAGRPPAPRQNFEAVHSNDILPTLLNYASRNTPLATAAVDCPASPNRPAGVSERCNGLDLSLRLLNAEGTPLGASLQAATTQGVRSHLCGHLTKRVSSPERKRFLITDQWKTGRCVPRAPVGTPPAALPGGFGFDPDKPYGSPPRAMFSSVLAERTCEEEGTECCPDGRVDCQDPKDRVGICIRHVCRAAPACVFDDAGTWDSCKDLFPSNTDLECVPPATATRGWCVANPNKQCASAADCPCSGAGCDTTCTARLFKLYLGAPGSGSSTDVPELAMTDLLLDPNERQAGNLGDGDPDGILERRDAGTIAAWMSGGTPGTDLYESTRKRLSCCVEEWWNGLDPPEAEVPPGTVVEYCTRFPCPWTSGCS